MIVNSPGSSASFAAGLSIVRDAAGALAILASIAPAAAARSTVAMPLPRLRSRLPSVNQRTAEAARSMPT